MARSRTALTDHIREEHDQDVEWRCQQCGFRDGRVRVMAAHYYKCQKDSQPGMASGPKGRKSGGAALDRLCGTSQTIKISYPPQLACSLCDDPITSRLGLADHYREHHGLVVEWSCSQCRQFEYTSLPSISGHLTRCTRRAGRTSLGGRVSGGNSGPTLLGQSLPPTSGRGSDTGEPPMLTCLPPRRHLHPAYKWGSGATVN